MNKFLNHLMLFIGLFILDILYSEIIITGLKLIGFDIYSLNSYLKTTYLILISLSYMLILYFIYRKEINREFFRFFRYFGKNFTFGLKMWIIGLILMIVSNLAITHFYPSVAANEEAVQTSLKTLPIYTAFASCIFAPFVEEIIFRKCLRKVFSSNTLFIIISGLLFGLAHNLGTLLMDTNSMQLLYIIPYGLFGSVFAYTYVKTKTIFTPILFHMVHNTILVMISLSSVGVI